MLVISNFLISCKAVENKRLDIDRKFSSYEVLKEYVVATEGLRSVSSGFDLNDRSFTGVPSDKQKFRFNIIRSFLEENEIKSISKLDSEISFNLYNAGVFGSGHLSFVYSETPELSVKLTTPESWKCLPYKIQNWFVCENS